MVKDPPSDAGDVGSIPGQRTKMPHGEGQLSQRAATTEPTCSGAQEPQLERSLHATTKSPSTTTKDPTCRNEDPVCCN